MRSLLLIAAVLGLVIAAGGYAAMPFHAAWQIREAVRTGDTTTLRTRVDWQSVRQSLKSSLAETRLALGELAEVAGVEKPGVWQRVKSVVFPYLADPLIERYVTAEGAPRLYAWRQTWRQRVAGPLRRPEPATMLAGTWLADTAIDRHATFLHRLERARFVSPRRLEITFADRHRAGRLWHAALELRGLGWQLTEMRVVTAPTASRARVAALR